MENNKTTTKEKPAKWRQPISLKSSDLKISIDQVLDLIQKTISKNRLSYIKILSEINADMLSNLSKRSKKRIVKQVYKLNQKLTLKRINKFLSFLSRIIPDLGLYTVGPSVEEQKIIDLRNKFKKSKEEFLKIKNEFKNSKKEFNSSGNIYFA